MTQYRLGPDDIYLPPVPVTHRDDEYDQGGFAVLLDMQERHFWYRGRHRFLLGAVDRRLAGSRAGLSAIDLGGGVGGWVRYLGEKRPALFTRLALGDSSLVALSHARAVLPPGAQRYQIDVMNLHMHQDWDVAFLLDVLEHLPDDRGALQQVEEALKPGGLLFVTTPAFPQFWSYADDLAHHLRRYRRADFARLAGESGLILLDARYFMSYLSPLYFLSRMRPGLKRLSEDERRALVLKQHEVPAAPINSVLRAIFMAETPVGHWLHLPWGTSVLGVFRKE